MHKIAVFPGSFDPITTGHVDVVRRALPLFDKIIIAIGINSQKKYLFKLEDRKAWMRKIFSEEPKISIDSYEGLTVDFCMKNNANFIIRGLRTSSDFHFEMPVAQLNQKLKNIETVCLITRPEFSHISSTIVREIYVNGGDISQFVPGEIDFKT